MDDFDLARNAFGRDVTSCYDSLLQTARALLSGEENPKAPPSQRAIRTWAAGLEPAERQIAFALCQELAFGTLFCIMNVFDGSRASFLPRGSRYRLVAGSPTGVENAGGTAREIELNPSNPDEDLHDALLGWIERFSKFGLPPL